MKLLTFAEAQGSLALAAVSGVCSNSDQFRSYLNQATRKLMTRGNFFGTVEKMCVCVNNCIVWPRYVGTVLAVNSCGGELPSKNQWYSFLSKSSGNGYDGFSFLNGNWHGNAAITDGDLSPVFNNVPHGTARYIRAYPDQRNDVGTAITIYGLDEYGQEIKTKQPDGSFSLGFPIINEIPFGTTPFRVRTITRVSKPVTQTTIRLYQYDDVANMTYPCAEYAAHETEPAYRTSRLSYVASNVCPKYVEALVKLEFIPVVSPTDLVLISNLDALQLMIQSLRLKESGDPEISKGYERDAISELNLELRNRFPNSKIPTKVHYFGNTTLHRSRIGRPV